MKISIICLIYKSIAYAKSVRLSLEKNTPMLSTGDAELLFVANDATKNVLDFLKDNNYNFIINNNKILTNDELFELGYTLPEYIHRVYKGYNFGIKNCKGEIVVLINSDHMFSPNWLENLIIHLEEDKILSPKTVERRHPVYGVFPEAIQGNFGNHPSNFEELEFNKFVEDNSVNLLTPGGVYMPCIVYKSKLYEVGLFPEGNICHRKNFYKMMDFGDVRLFKLLEEKGIKHYTVNNSFVYHFKEGEKEENE